MTRGVVNARRTQRTEPGQFTPPGIFKSNDMSKIKKISITQAKLMRQAFNAGRKFKYNLSTDPCKVTFSHKDFYAWLNKKNIEIISNYD